MKILAIETSCDETAAAVVEDGVHVLSNVIASSTAMHQKWGGIVPEVAAREQLKCIIPVISEALQQAFSPASHLSPQDPASHFPLASPAGGLLMSQIDAIAVTVGPGLIGSLLIGVETAKTLSFVTGKPLIPVNHVLAHMYANFVTSLGSDPALQGLTLANSIQFPAISLVVSGGHTELFLMKSMKDLKWLGGTIDDAAGEAFDKTARLLGFGNRGGVAIQEAASKCQMLNAKCQIKLPRPIMHDKTLNFSFSGLKTAILREVNKLKESKQFNTETIGQLAFETQEAITDVLVTKTMRAAEIHSATSIFVSGGVAANTRLRQKFHIHHSTFSIHTPPIQLCTDNAVYIASYAYFRGKPIPWEQIEATPDLSVEID